ncbi:nhl-1 [Symbiodinium sp. CCMP2592]|nr:nhl-1 [Symbiodinium sp. CCMP2592]
MARVADSAYAGEVLVGGAEPLAGPMGVALAPDGGLIVVDTDQNRILKCPNWQLQGFQQAACALLAGGSSSGFEADRLRTPYTALPAQVVGETFGLVVADTHNHRIQYWPAGATQGYTLVGGPGVGAPGYTGPGELQFPAGIALDEDAGYLYVSDTGHHRVVRYTLDANMQVVGAGVTVAGTYGTSGTDANLLDNPTALFLDAPRHRLYVADARNNRVMLWLLTPYLLDSEGITARRLSSIDSDTDGNETGNTTTSITETTTSTATTSSTYTSTISSTRTTSTTTSTTSTMYEGPRYQLYITGLVGRPYGLFSQDDAWSADEVFLPCAYETLHQC